uniref:Uncharacterized protein n=1 Tax=Phytophthora ramorum TaxID=164328 RepID=H3HC22_PHYRM
MASLQERLRSMVEAPRRRQRGQIPKDLVDAAHKFQREFVHKSLDFNTADISDCAESLEVLRDGKREARESRQMMWEDHYASQLATGQAKSEAAKQQKLRQETSMLTQLRSDSDKWNMAIDLRLLAFIDASLSVASEDAKRAYFISTNKAGLPPLHRACKTNDMELVKLLLRLGADLTTKDQLQKSVFHVMAEFRLTDLFKFLAAMLTTETDEILLGFDCNGYSLLHIAAANDMMNSLVHLVTQDEKRTALHLAALRGHISCVEILLKMTDAKTDVRDRRGFNALHLALQQTFDIDKLVAVFLAHTPSDQAHATFSSLDEVAGQSCLHTAILKNFRRVTIAMIRSGKVQINGATREGGWTPLHLAVITEEIDVVKELLAAGATLDAVDADGQTPLLQACLGGQLKIVRLLLDAGANPSHQNKQAHSPLHYLSAFCRDRQLLRDIIANGADVNAKSMKLNTPMHFAAMNGNEVATQVLLEHGASASVINEDRRSVVYLAKKWRHRSVEDLVRPPEEEGDQGDVRSLGRYQVKPKSPLAMASRQAQLRSMGHARAKPHAHSRPAVMTTRSEESDSDSLTFGELRDRYMGQRSPLKPVVLAQDRQKPLMDELSAARAKREEQPSALSAPMTRFSRQLVVDPVRIPWEMTVPIAHAASADALSYQRKLKPSIRTNIGLLRDHLAHAPQLHWPRHASHPNEEASFIRRVVAPDRPNPKRRQTKRLAAAGAALVLIGASAGVGYATLRAGQLDATATPAKQQMAASLEVPDFVESMGDPYYPSFEVLDRNGDGIVSYPEYMSDLDEVWAKNKEDIANSDLPEVVKDDLYDQLNEKIASDTTCVKKAMVPTKKRSLTFDKKTIDSLYYMLDVYCFETPIEIPQKYIEMFPTTQAPVATPEPSIPVAQVEVDTPQGPAIVTPVGPVIDDKQVVSITTADGSKSTTIVDVMKTSDGNNELEIPTGPGGETTTVTIPSQSTTTEGSYANGYPSEQQGTGSNQALQVEVDTPQGPAIVTPVGPVIDDKQVVSITTADGSKSTTIVDVMKTSDGNNELEIPTGPGGETTTVTIPSQSTTTEGSYANGYPSEQQGTGSNQALQVEVDTPQGPAIVTPVGPVIDDKQVVSITTADGSKSTTIVDVMKTSDGNNELEIPTGPGGETTTVTIPSQSTTTEGSYADGSQTVPQSSIKLHGELIEWKPMVDFDASEGFAKVIFNGPVSDGQVSVTLLKYFGNNLPETMTLPVAKLRDGSDTVDVPVGPGDLTKTVPVPAWPGNENVLTVPKVEFHTPEGPAVVTPNGPVIDGRQDVTIIKADGSTSTTTVKVIRTSDGKTELEIPTGPEGEATTVTLPSPSISTVHYQAPQVEVDTPQGPVIVTPVGPVIDDKQVVSITTMDGNKSTTIVDVIKTSDGNNELGIPTGSRGETTIVTNGVDNGDKDFMTKDDFQLQIGSHFSEKVMALKGQAHDEEAESTKILKQQQELQDCIVQAANKFGFYGVYEQPPHFQNAVDWIDNDCMKQ